MNEPKIRIKEFKNQWLQKEEKSVQSELSSLTDELNGDGYAVEGLKELFKE